MTVIVVLQNYAVFVNKSSNINYTLEFLPSFTDCSVTVRAKPNYQDEIYGFWSENKTITFRSQEGGFLSDCYNILL